LGGYQLKLYHLLAIIPFIGLLGGISFANKVTPYVFGLPFILFYVVFWVVMTSVIMYFIFKLDPTNKEESV
jgi:hypothetical protein